MATIRLPVVVAAFAALTLVGCSMPQSSSTGTAPTAAASAPGYAVPPGYVSGQNIIPYAGRIATKCEHQMSEQARKGCITSGG